MRTPSDLEPGFLLIVTEGNITELTDYEIEGSPGEILSDSHTGPHHPLVP